MQGKHVEISLGAHVSMTDQNSFHSITIENADHDVSEQKETR